MTIEDFILNLEKVRRRQRGFLALCPAHGDRVPSLSVSEGDDGRILLHCFSGCSAYEIVESLGLDMKDLFQGQGSPSDEEVFRRDVNAKKKEAAGKMADVYRKAEKLLDAVSGIDISTMSVKDQNKVMELISPAIEIRNLERRENAN